MLNKHRFVNIVIKIIISFYGGKQTVLLLYDAYDFLQLNVVMKQE